MSDTPKTDKLAKREFVPDGVWIRHARELERENAALREDRDRLDAIQHGWSVSCEEGASGNPDRWFIWTRDWSQPIGEGWSLRAAIDDARKEDKP